MRVITKGRELSDDVIMIDGGASVIVVNEWLLPDINDEISSTQDYSANRSTASVRYSGQLTKELVARMSSLRNVYSFINLQVVLLAPL